MIDDLIDAIEPALGTRKDLAERFGLGVRLFMLKAQSDLEWCGFVARVWKIGELQYPLRDIQQGIKKKIFKVPSVEAARDVQMGTIREAMLRIVAGEAPKNYGEQIAEVCLQALGVEKARIAEIMSLPLPEVKLPEKLAA